MKERKSLFNTIVNIAASFLFGCHLSPWYPKDFLSLAAIYFGKKTDAAHH